MDTSSFSFIYLINYIKHLESVTETKENAISASLIYSIALDKSFLRRLLSSSTGGLGVLTSNTQAPEVSDTSVRSDLLQSLQVVSQLGFDTVS